MTQQLQNLIETVIHRVSILNRAPSRSLTSLDYNKVFKGLTFTITSNASRFLWRPTSNAILRRYYKKVQQDKLRPAIRKNRPGLLESGILFHHDNAPAHTAQAVTDVLAGYKWELLEHPRYSPDFAPCDFHLFPKMK
ncbi:mariner Mos1 transposase [Elysia marginata]|uniref:Mariner Mos1 transposase n=1 Tax=Elysia marginata TaxID=1093978 RepID=A0AAV4H4Z5_9GAST|nr:mariner Mos1 transposase [Elysia marginata]